MSKELKAKDIPAMIAGGTVIFPVLLGYHTFSLGINGWFIVSALAGAFAMYCHDSRRAVLSVICGIIIGLSASAATLWYFDGRGSFFQIEVLIPLILGLIPGGLIYIVGKALWIIPPVIQTESDPFSNKESPKKDIEV